MTDMFSVLASMSLAAGAIIFTTLVVVTELADLIGRYIYNRKVRRLA